jgi:hypothetical protein
LILKQLKPLKMRAAQDLWNIICRKAGVNIPLTFQQDNTLPIGSYSVVGTHIKHNSTTANAAAVMAVAAIAEALFDAIMIHPSEDGIIVQIKEPDNRHLQINYTPRLIRNNYVNLSAGGWDRTWFHWHHIPTEGSGGPAFHRSWLIGLAQKYPQLAPPTGTPRENTKVNIWHPHFPEIFYNECKLRGMPPIISCFEIDGTGFWPVGSHIPAPSYLNPSEKEQFEKGITQGYYPNLRIGQLIRAADGRRYPVTENLFYAAAAIGLQNKYARSTSGWRYNYTALYLKAWLKVRDYFEATGATHVRFNILAYSNYRCLPNGQWDLRRFNVFYTSPTARAWTDQEMIEDAREFVKWKTAVVDGTPPEDQVKVIWRPNHLFRFENRLIHPLVSTYLQITRPDGLQLAPYYPPTFPFGNGIDYYATFRTIQGKPYLLNYLTHAPTGYSQWHDTMIDAQINPGTDEDDIG